MKEWEKHFRGVLGVVEWRVKEERGEREEGDEKKISKEEIERVVKKLKKGKAAGKDGSMNEVWKYRGKEVRE